MALTANLPASLIGLEACSGSHFLARALREQGHDARLIPATGGRTTLLGISKRGNPYLRKMLIHGARAAVLRLRRDGSSLGAWIKGLEARVPRNVVIVAVANKLARLTWAVLASGEPYRAATLAA